MPPDVKTTRGIINRSTGGAPCGFNASAGFVRSISSTRPPSNTTGSRATTTAQMPSGESGAASWHQVSRAAASARNGPIHPSSANSLWWAWNMKVARDSAKSFSRIAALALAQHHRVGVLVGRQ